MKNFMDMLKNIKLSTIYLFNEKRPPLNPPKGWKNCNETVSEIDDEGKD